MHVLDVAHRSNRHGVGNDGIHRIIGKLQKGGGT